MQAEAAPTPADHAPGVAEALLPELENQLVALCEGFLYYLAHYVAHWDAGVSILETTAKKRGMLFLDTEETALNLFGPKQRKLHDIAKALTRSLAKVENYAEETMVPAFHQLRLTESLAQMSEGLVRSGDLEGQDLLARRDMKANAIRYWMNAKDYAEKIDNLLRGIETVRDHATLGANPLDQAGQDFLGALGDLMEEFFVMRDLVTHVLEATHFPHELRNQRREIELGGLKSTVDLDAARGAGKRARREERWSSAPREATPAPAGVAQVDQAIVIDLLDQEGLFELPTVDQALQNDNALDTLYSAFVLFYKELHTRGVADAAVLALAAVCRTWDPAALLPHFKEVIVSVVHKFSAIGNHGSPSPAEEDEVANIFKELLALSQGWK